MITVEQLKGAGKIWLAWVKLQDRDPAEVTQIFEQIKGKLDIKLGRGWQKYDPVIKKEGPNPIKNSFRNWIMTARNLQMHLSNISMRESRKTLLYHQPYTSFSSYASVK